MASSWAIKSSYSAARLEPPAPAPAGGLLLASEMLEEPEAATAAGAGAKREKPVLAGSWAPVELWVDGALEGTAGVTDAAAASPAMAGAEDTAEEATLGNFGELLPAGPLREGACWPPAARLAADCAAPGVRVSGVRLRLRRSDAGIREVTDPDFVASVGGGASLLSICLSNKSGSSLDIVKPCARRISLRRSRALCRAIRWGPAIVEGLPPQKRSIPLICISSKN